MRCPPSWMLQLIHTRVAQRAAIVEYQYSWQIELQKSDKLVQIEMREKETGKLDVDKLKKLRFNRLVL